MSSNSSRSGGQKRGSATSSSVTGSTNTSATKNSTTYNQDFCQNLKDHGIFDENYALPDGRDPPLPSNIEEINKRLAQARPSLSPSRFTEKEYKNFLRATKNAPNEEQVMRLVIPTIEGTIKDPKCVGGNILFSNLEALTDGELSAARPDIFHASRAEDLDRQIRKQYSC
jgi:hypothetical protein